MHTFVKRALWGTIIAGGMTLVGATAASAADTSGEDGLLSGTQLDAPISITVDLVDNALSVIGNSSVSAPAAEAAPESTSVPDSSLAPAPSPSEAAVTDGADGVGSGSQALVNVDVPVNVTGNSIAVLGESAVIGDTGHTQTDSAAVDVRDAPEDDAPGAPAAITDGADAVLGGTQVLAPVAAPVTVGGNAISLLGESSVVGSNGQVPAATTVEPVGLVTGGSDGLLSGSQIAAPISLPITVGGNGIAVLGESMVTAPTATPVPGPVPGTDPSPAPATDPGPAPAPAPAADLGVTTPPGAIAAPTAMAAGADMLAATGTAGLLQLALIGLALLGTGGLLLRRAA